MKIIVYGKPNCPQCDWTKRLLDEMELIYETVDVTLDLAAKHDVDKMIIDGKPVMTLPVVVVSNSKRTERWVGLKVDKLRGLKHSTGDY